MPRFCVIVLLASSCGSGATGAVAISDDEPIVVWALVVAGAEMYTQAETKEMIIASRTNRAIVQLFG